MDEIWTRWEPIAGLKPKYYIEYILEDLDIFKVRLYADYKSKERLDVIFDGTVEAHRRTDETLRLKVVADLKDNYGREFYASWTFFKITESRYLQWISEQSCTISNDMGLKHFVFLAADSLLDVADIGEPTFEHIMLP